MSDQQALVNPVEMESIVVRCGKEVLELLHRSEEAGVEEIVEIMSEFSRDGEEAFNTNKLQARKAVMSRMLVKSLQAGDTVFERISHAVYLATRGVVLAGNGPQGRKLAEMALRRVGAVDLTDRVVAAAEILLAVATVSVNVHGQWYKYLTDNM